MLYHKCSYNIFTLLAVLLDDNSDIKYSGWQRLSMRGFRFWSVLDIAALAFGQRCAAVKPTPKHSLAHERYPRYEIKRTGKTAYPGQFSAKLVVKREYKSDGPSIYKCKFSIPKFLWKMHLPIANLEALSYEMKIACLSSQIFNESVSHAQYVGAYICSSYVFFSAWVLLFPWN